MGVAESVFPMYPETERIRRFKNLASQRVMILDGATGTSIQKENLSAADFGGEQYEGCNEHLNKTRPDIVQKIHRGYLEAGADIIETNTFGSTSIVLAEYDLAEEAYELSRLGAALAREMADEYSTPEKPRFVAGSMGPTTKALSLTGGATFDEMKAAYYTQAKGLVDGGVDLLYIETVQDTLNLKAAAIAVMQLREEYKIQFPVMLSATIEPTGTMLGGQSIESFWASVEHLHPISVGINCATGPSQMRDHIRTLSQISHTCVSCMPNAGLPDEDGNYNETPEKLSSVLHEFGQDGWLNIVGGCCGTTPEHIRKIAESFSSIPPRKIDVKPVSFLSGIDYLELDSQNRPYLIAERTNVIGSRNFKNMIIEGRLEEGAEIARKQVKAGAHIIDVCLSNPDRDEMADMMAFLPVLLKKVKAPLMIDSTDKNVMEASLKLVQGKAIINSINLEDGRRRFDEVVPLALQYGAALVVGTIDEDPESGMALTPERKLAIAERSYHILTEEFHFPETDIYFDPLVFPIGTGDEKYIGSSAATIEGLRRIKERFPNVKSTMGVSNVSFGLPAAGREVLNSVFLYHAVKNGLDSAIVNTEKLKRYASIPEEEKTLAEKLIFHTKEEYRDALTAFANFYKDKKDDVASLDERRDWPPEKVVFQDILDGSKEGLIPALDKLLASGLKPLDIVNGPMMQGMAQVGTLFNENKLIVAEVLESAETMKAAVGYLEGFMEKADTSKKSRVILATVKGDVHDIGKNLVEIILTNNGYDVIDLGIKVPPEKIIEAYHQYNPDYIGLSGLLVKSAQQMVSTAADMKKAGIQVPLFVGGAALSENFARNKIQPEYAGSIVYSKDAMTGLSQMNHFSDPQLRADMEKIWSIHAPLPDAPPSATTKRETLERTKWVIDYNYGPKAPVDLKTHVFPADVATSRELEEAFGYINDGMLYKNHLGYKGNLKNALETGDPKVMELKNVVDKAMEILTSGPPFGGRGVFRFFRAASEGNRVYLYNDKKTEKIATLEFPRQTWGWEISLADYIAPKDSGLEDFLGMFVVSAGFGIRAKVKELKERGEYLLAHTLQSVALESAEGMAEWVHQKMRAMWGWPDAPGTEKKDLFRNSYAGLRYSFGYPACPNLEDQKVIWNNLKPEETIGVELTEGFMMEPEASVSAIVFQHPDARYFSVHPEEEA